MYKSKKNHVNSKKEKKKLHFLEGCDLLEMQPEFFLITVEHISDVIYSNFIRYLNEKHTHWII